MLLTIAGSVAACGGASNKGPQTGGIVSPPKAIGGACVGAKSNARPMTKNAASSTLALATVAGKRVAFVADEDAKAILTVDLDTQAQLAETRVGGTPSQVWIGDDGRILATLRDKSELVMLSATRPDAPLTGLCSAETPAEPIAIAATPDGSTILVTAGWGQALAAFDANTLASKYDVKLPREPRSVVVADDGKTAFVSHAVGSVVSAVSLASSTHEQTAISMRGFEPGRRKNPRGLISQATKNATTGRFSPAALIDRMSSEQKRIEEGRPSCQGFALAKSTAVGGRIFAPQVMVDPGNLEERPDGYGDQHTETETPAVAVIDEGASTTLSSSTTLMRTPKVLRSLSRDGRDGRSERPGCLLPRAAVVDPRTKSLLVTCYGIDAVIAFDATAANPLAAERRRWTVGSGPSGVAVDTERQRIVVWSQFDRTISTFAVGDDDLIDESRTPLKVKRTALAPLREKLSTEYALGRILFHAAGDARISSDGRACASCHPDGRDDAITWATPEGPRRSISLAGRATQTAPYSWNGDEATLHGHLGNTFDRLSGRGVRSIELDALVTYVSQMPAPPVQTVASRSDKSKVERGRAIFASAEAGCATCHSGPSFTDGVNHDVGSRHKADRASSFNTPSLHLVGGGGPYFHDGRYDTLGELLTRSDGQMGHTKHLSNADLDALETYLRTL